MDFKTASRGLAVSALLCLVASATAAADRITETDVDKAMAASPAAPIYAAIQKYFPDDAAQWRRELAKLAKRKSGEIVFPREALALGAKIHKRHAPALQYASGESLREVVVVQYAMHATFKNNPDTCNRLILGGPRDLSNAELEQIATMANDIEAQFAAMHEGTTNPVQHGAPTQEAWQGFYDSFRAQGNSNTEYDLIIEPTDDPALCDAFLGMLAVLRDGEFNGADAVRATIVPALVGS